MKEANSFYNQLGEKSQLISDADRLARGLSELPLPVVEPVLILISGLPGVGKSLFCQRLTERLPAVILESDSLRRILFGQPDYSQTESARLFKAIRLLAKRLLKIGLCIIVDATNLSEHHRKYFYSIAECSKVKLIIVSIEAPQSVVKKRLAARLKNQDEKSEADWEVYKKMKPSVEKITRKHYVVDTSRDTTPTIDKIISEISSI
ncbi:MAG: ATP-binding protein [Dehalococcoidia bacterium]|nr:MAG: ATP-binding protein [Dehalococcoidia bacterium]